MSLTEPYMIACSGAVTEDVIGGVASPQISALSDYTEYVTITIGGNDAGFAKVLGSCVETLTLSGYGCSADAAVINPLNDRLAALDGGAAAYTDPDSMPIHSIANVLTEIATKAPNAEIYIAGYPHLFGSSTAYYIADATAPGGFRCNVSAFPDINVSFADAQFMNEVADELNSIIEDAVLSVQPLNVTYVGSTEFNGHGRCDSAEPWLNGIQMPSTGIEPLAESMHPTVDGMMYGYGVAFYNAMN